MKGLQVQPTGAHIESVEGAHDADDVSVESHVINMVMHVSTRALRSSVRQNKRHVKREHIKSLVQDAIDKHIAKQRD